MTAPLHPGLYVKQEKERRGMTQRELAAALGYNAAYVSRVISGAYPIGPRFALALEALWGVDAEVWCRLQSDFDVMCARNAATAPQSGRGSR